MVSFKNVCYCFGSIYVFQCAYYTCYYVRQDIKELIFYKTGDAVDTASASLLRRIKADTNMVYKYTGSLDDLPKSVDWRDKGIVSPPLQQVEVTTAFAPCSIDSDF